MLVLTLEYTRKGVVSFPSVKTLMETGYLMVVGSNGTRRLVKTNSHISTVEKRKPPEKGAFAL